ncbi:alpha/beta hydrolase fold domain-containing protein [Pigmentiphaga sp.]|uniref:alpha/beta hydrolase n=1 Tax=Pigmentiphaga sp. TaxID=1977564 RepID=UPI003424B06A
MPCVATERIPPSAICVAVALFPNVSATVLISPAWPNPTDSVVPAKTGLHDFPPVWLGVGDSDPLIEDSHMFAGRLAGMNRQHRLAVYPGIPHGFSASAESVPMAAGATRDAAVFMKRAVDGVSDLLKAEKSDQEIQPFPLQRSARATS